MAGRAVESDLWLLALAIVFGVATMVLATVEEAFGAVSRAHVAELARTELRGAEVLIRMLADRARYVNGLLFARITTGTFAVVSVTVLCMRLIGSPSWLGPVVAGLIMLLVGYVGFGVAAQTVGQQHSAGVAVAWRWLARVCHWAFGWLATLMIYLGNAVTPGRGYRHGPFTTQSELRELVDLAEADHVIEAGEREMIHSVFELGGTLVRSIMVPRTDIVSIESDSRIREAISLALSSGFSRIPVVGEDVDDIVGIVYLKDLVTRLFEDQHEADSIAIAEVMRPAMFIPDSKAVDELLREMQAARVHLAIVVDEYGGTGGLVTIEDVVEEVVGEIADEYDQSDTADVVETGPGVWRVSPRLSLSDLHDVTGVDVSEAADAVETVAGLLALRLGSVPVPGSSIHVTGYRLVAEPAAGGGDQIGSVLVTTQDDPRQDTGGDGDLEP